VAELLDADARRTADGPDDAVTVRLFDAIAGYLTGASHAVPLIVVLDHVHRASPDALRLLAHLAESVPASRLLVVISYRSGEAEAMVGTSAALARIGTVRIELAGLTVGETQRLATAMLGREVPAATAESLSDRTAGNPLFLREMIKLLTSDDRQEQAGTAPVPAAVRDVLLARIGQLPETTAHLLSVAAVAGRSFRIDVVAEAASLEPDVAMESIDQAITADLVTEDHERAGWFHFHHALAAEALYERIAQLDRVRLHRSIGEAAARAWTENTQRAAHLAAHWPLMFCRAARQ
jgi:predicted ATPase